jgi:hypothetical protein
MSNTGSLSYRRKDAKQPLLPLRKRKLARKVLNNSMLQRKIYHAKNCQEF